MKIITINLEVAEDVDPEQFLEAITQHVHESEFGGSDKELEPLISGIVNVSMISYSIQPDGDESWKEALIDALK